MWEISLSHWSEFVLRAIVVYFFLFGLLRLTGKRQVGQLAPFDLVLLLILSNAVQNAMNGGDNSVTGGLILASTLIGINLCLGWLAFRSKRLEGLIEGRPIILVHHGEIVSAALKEAQMTTHDLNAVLREAGHVGAESVRYAVLETTGKVSVIAMR